MDGFSVFVGGDSNQEFSQQRDHSGQPDTNDFDDINAEGLEIEGPIKNPPGKHLLYLMIFLKQSALWHKHIAYFRRLKNGNDSRSYLDR